MSHHHFLDSSGVRRFWPRCDLLLARDRSTSDLENQDGRIAVEEFFLLRREGPRLDIDGFGLRI